MFKAVVAFLLTFSLNPAFSQAEKGKYSQSEYNSVVSIKPADGIPNHVKSKDELEKTIPSKIIWLKELILSGKYDEDSTIKIRESLWRMENAIIQEEK